MLIDPWGEVLGCREDGPGVVIAEIDLQHESAVRQRFPALTQRRL
jgi:nitrilase